MGTLPPVIGASGEVFTGFETLTNLPRPRRVFGSVIFLIGAADPSSKEGIAAFSKSLKSSNSQNRRSGCGLSWTLFRRRHELRSHGIFDGFRHNLIHGSQGRL